MITVTKPYLPNQKKYQAYINQIYENGFLTNKGPLVQQLEERLASYLGVKHVICVANGSNALQVSYKALDLKGEVITTPFSFVATSSTLAWEGLKPIFADIDLKSFNLDPDNIEPLINQETSAIVPVHVFGNPCNVERIKEIADKHNLKVIYDAAHAFGVNYKGESILNYGDISTLSFHATKLFHTIEGGAVVTNCDDIAQKVRLLINFGITSPVTVESIGTNAKMNEMEAAMGLCNLDEIERIRSNRLQIWKKYQKSLFDHVEFQEWNKYSENNCAYMPVLLKSEEELLDIEKKLKEKNICARRYFHPSLDCLDYLKTDQVCKISRSIVKRVLCLPIYVGLEASIQESIAKIFKRM
jgi:dTDP-4-amino-4,6-dideoxygalactose transaminase